ncbi:MAG TPA: hypothetical protein VFO89_16840, partial [Thermoanaerobaculia bacterium]|nr:hypothetical protein [Thermoanaerobaculia bacterium]
IAVELRNGAAWFEHEKGATSLQARLGLYLIEKAARDYDDATSLQEVRRSVFGTVTLHKALGVERAYGDNDPLTYAARDLAASLKIFGHYFRAAKRNYKLTLTGPTPRSSGVAVKAPGKHADYFLKVEWQRIPAREVPDDRRVAQPGHLSVLRGEAPDARGRFRWNMPTLTPDFIGRTPTLRRFLRAFAHAEERSVVATLEGWPGVGKTEFVAAASRALLRRYGDAHVYLSAGTETEPRSAEDILRDALDWLEREDAARPTTLEGLSARYRAALHGRRCLIVCENVTVYGRIAPLVPPNGSALILTSRAPLGVPGAPGLWLQPLAATGATAFLMRAVPDAAAAAAEDLVLAASRGRSGARAANDRRGSRSRSASVAVSPACSHRPTAARYLVLHPDVSPEDFARAFLSERRRLTLTAAKAETLSVEASFNLTYARLDAAERRAFGMLGVFPGSFTAHAATLVLGDLAATPSAAPHGVVSELVAYGLLRWDGALRRYSMHELLRLFARHRSEEADRARAMEGFLRFCHTLGAHRQRAYAAGFTDEQVMTEALAEEDVPTVTLAVGEYLRRSEASVDALYACSDIVLGFAAATLGRDARRLYDWCTDLAARFRPLADAGYHHERLPTHDDPGLRVSGTWGDARTRWAEHSFDRALAAESLGDDAEALETYRELARQSSFPIAGDVPPGLLFRSRERAIRVLRHQAVPPAVIEEAQRALLRDRPLIAGSEGVLHTLVYAAAAWANGEADEAIRVVRGMMKNHKGARMYWAEALYLDAVADTPSAWVKVRRRYRAVPEGDAFERTIDGYLLGAASGFAEHDILRDVRAWFSRSRRERPLLLLAFGEALGRVSAREHSTVYGESVRIAEAIGDSAMLTA